MFTPNPRCVIIRKKSAEALILSLFNAVLLIELINTSVGPGALLLSRIERMALGTDLNVDIFLCRTYNKCITAVTGYGCLMICGM